MTTSGVRVRSTRARPILLSGFLATIALIGVVWWPLLRDYLAGYDPAFPWWRQTDFLLIGIFAAMTWLIMARADVRTDARLVAVGLLGGLAIESWGTQTGLWAYYTQERPPLWILPAWPIATLSIDRILHALSSLAPAGRPRLYRWLHLLVLGGFFLLMLAFVRPTWSEPSTLIALSVCALLIARPTNERTQLLTFVAGTGLGYFLERWGTTRECWTYYTLQTPPLFAVLAHGMASVAFWRVLEGSERWGQLVSPLWRRLGGSSTREASRT